MSRSKHTVPPRLRAPRRVRAPQEPRGHGDASAHRALSRAFKELGIEVEPAACTRDGDDPVPLPRVCAARPRPGCHHPATPAEIRRLLRLFGARCIYGLRAIELSRGEEGSAAGALRLGRLFVPGRIVLYDQAPSPWSLNGTLPAHEREKLTRAGAQVEVSTHGSWVTWPEDTLRDFMLFDVLMHEIGHHLVQQYKGKRLVRVVRTRDHEAFADQFARQCRLIYRELTEARS
jgi:hypothetical protein